MLQAFNLGLDGRDQTMNMPPKAVCSKAVCSKTVCSLEHWKVSLRVSRLGRPVGIFGSLLADVSFIAKNGSSEISNICSAAHWLAEPGIAAGVGFVGNVEAKH